MQHSTNLGERAAASPPKVLYSLEPCKSLNYQYIAIEKGITAKKQI